MRRDGEGELLYLRRTIVFLVGLAIIVAAVFFIVRGKPKFLLTELRDDEIFAGEETILNVQVRNPTAEDYDNVEVQLATKSPYLIFEPYPEASLARVGDENRLTLSVGFLGSREESKKYGFHLRGSLPPGTRSMEVEMVVRLWMGGEKVDERIYTLAIESK